MILTPERALAFVQAADQKLDYLPGEVLLKFKDAVTPVGQQRALMALRSRPDVSDLHWLGDVALFTDQRERDATVLAAQLSAQPEITYAEPNYLLHKMSTPNDPSFASRQWNFSAIDLPRAWDINTGSNASVIIAVVDYGITDVNPCLELIRPPVSACRRPGRCHIVCLLVCAAFTIILQGGRHGQVFSRTPGLSQEDDGVGRSQPAGCRAGLGTPPRLFVG